MARKPRTTNGSEAGDGTEAAGQTQSTARTKGQITIQGIIFDTPSPYAEGHAINAAEAATLNQVLSENLRNNFSGTVKKALEQAEKDGSSVDVAGLQAAFVDYATNYEFHGKRPQRAALDPVSRQAEKLAKDAILAAMRKNKIDTKSLAEGKMEELVEQLLAKKPEIREEAARRVEAAKAVAIEGLEELGISA